MPIRGANNESIPTAYIYLANCFASRLVVLGACAYSYASCCTTVSSPLACSASTTREMALFTFGAFVNRCNSFAKSIQTCLCGCVEPTNVPDKTLVPSSAAERVLELRMLQPGLSGPNEKWSGSWWSLKNLIRATGLLLGSRQMCGFVCPFQPLLVVLRLFPLPLHRLMGHVYMFILIMLSWTRWRLAHSPILRTAWKPTTPVLRRSERLANKSRQRQHNWHYMPRISSWSG